ncbi:hypothetical protein Sjap_024014 [Stephania japonica]|uniref:Uncharacterized protein n=1 Tax=Stephania japonica TaxID=461633 RepID=A0AAP0HNB3_9MAGN
MTGLGRQRSWLTGAIIDPGTHFRYRIEMTDQRGLNDDSGTSSHQAVNIEEFRTLTQRVAAQERQLEEILTILRASVAALHRCHLRLE